MTTFRISEYLGGKDFAAGAGLGANHLERFKEAIGPSIRNDSELLVELDFESVELATASYIKSFLLTVYNCARLEYGDLPYAEAAETRPGLVPLPILPIVTNAVEEIEETVDEVFARRRLPILSLIVDGGTSRKAKLLGELDPAVLETLRYCCQLGETTATELSEKCPEAGLKPTGWSNRLDRLYRYRLLSRRKSGRNLIYKSIATEVLHGAFLSGK